MPRPYKKLNGCSCKVRALHMRNLLCYAGAFSHEANNKKIYLDRTLYLGMGPRLPSVKYLKGHDPIFRIESDY